MCWTSIPRLGVCSHHLTYIWAIIKVMLVWETARTLRNRQWCVRKSERGLTAAQRPTDMCLCNIHSVWSLCMFTVVRAWTVAYLSVANIIRARQRAGLTLNHYKTGRGHFSHQMSQQDWKSAGICYNGRNVFDSILKWLLKHAVKVLPQRVC